MRIIVLSTLCLILVLSCRQQIDQTHDEIINLNLDFQPNILWIVAEDLGPYIPSFGDSTVQTPNLDWLASTGVCYDNFYTPHPVCAPARASIITGMYANSIGASHMRTGPWFPGITPERINEYKALPAGQEAYEAVPPLEIRMFTEYMRSSGYYCTNNSKEDYQFRKTMTAWDESSREAHWRKRPKEKPFFSVFNIGVTHESRIWTKMDDSLWVDKDLQVTVPPYLPDNDVGIRDVRRMYSNILEMDHRVGQILEELSEDGLMDSTIVFWYTDHGGPLPRQKRMLYESGIKVPMIIRFPNNQFAGERDTRMISFIDLGPTVMSLVGIEPPQYMDGNAFLGDHIRSIEPEYVFGAADRFDELIDRARSVRDERFKYIKYYIPQKPMFLDVVYRRQMSIMQELLRLRDQGLLNEEQKLWFREMKPEEELFDILNDPHELKNLAKDPQYQGKLLELRQQCDQWVKSIDDTGLIPENELIQSFWPNFVQPVTSDPAIAISGSSMEISCATEGASIGYRLIENHPASEEIAWTVYDGAVQLNTNITQIMAVAHRIGYKRSEVIVKDVP